MLKLGPTFGEEPLVLVEVDDELLNSIIDGGVVIRGEAADEACLCTRSRTFVLRLAESSNTHYLLPGPLAPDRSPGLIVASVGTFLELKPTVPRLVKLRKLLSKRKYDGFDEHGDDADAAGADAARAGDKRQRLTTEQLRAAVQCSESELLAGLDVVHAIEMGGEWRMLDVAVRHTINAQLLNLTKEHGWARDALRVPLVLEQTAALGFAPEAVYHCLSTLCTQPLPRMAYSALPAEHSCALDARKVCAFCGENLLRLHPVLAQEAFLERWRDAADDFSDELAAMGVELTLKMLSAVAVQVQLNKVAHVQWLPVSALPTGTKERLASLFRIKKAWHLDEIAPFLDDVLEDEPGRTKEQILIQHARQTKGAAGEVIFVERV